jgi:hypothetical protein
VKAARGGLTLADVGEWSTYDCGHDVVARSAALADGSEDVLAAVYGPGSNDPTLFGWRVWAPGSPAHLPLASGPETGALGRAAADAALARMLGAGPAWSAEVEAEAGGVRERRLTSDQQSLAGLLPTGFTLRERDGLTEILLGETVISSADDPRQTLRGCFVAIKNALAFVTEVRRWAASGPKGCPPYTSGAEGMLTKLDESFALLMQTETSLRARLAAAEERAAKAEGERDEARRDLARVAGALGADSLDGETLLLRLAALRGSRP